MNGYVITYEFIWWHIPALYIFTLQFNTTPQICTQKIYDACKSSENITQELEQLIMPVASSRWLLNINNLYDKYLN